MTDDRDLQDKVLVAEIISPHGVNGAVSAELFSDNPRRFVAGAQFTTGQGASLRLVSASPHRGRLLLLFADVSDRTAAEKLRGVKLYIDKGEVEPLPQGSWYHFQLIGLTVFEQGSRLGVITGVLPYTANDIYVLKKDDGAELLIPALKSVVKQIDLEARHMDVALPEGL